MARLWWFLEDLCTGEIFKGKNSKEVVEEVRKTDTTKVEAAIKAVDTGFKNNTFNPYYKAE